MFDGVNDIIKIVNSIAWLRFLECLLGECTALWVAISGKIPQKELVYSVF